MANDRPDLNPFPVWGNYLDAVSELGEFVAGPTPSNPVGAAIQNRMREQCDEFSAGSARWATLGPAAQYGMSQHCQAYLSNAGYSQPELSQDPPPFTGVQCDCARYRLRAQGTYTDTFGNTNRPYSFPSQYIRGPLSSSRVELGPGGLADLRWTYECKGSDSVQYPACGAVQTFSRTLSTTSPPATVTSMEIVVLEAPDGDTCGDPPAPPPTFGPGPTPAPDPGLDPTDSPFQDPDGTVYLPQPELPNPYGDPIQLPNIPLFDLIKNALSGVGTTQPEADPGVAGDPATTGEGGSAEETAPEGEELVSVLVEPIAIPAGPRKVGNLPGQDIYVGAMYLFLGSEDGQELQEEGRFLAATGQMYYAERSSTTWRILATAGYNLRVTPYYREIQS